LGILTLLLLLAGLFRRLLLEVEALAGTTMVAVAVAVAFYTTTQLPFQQQHMLLQLALVEPQTPTLRAQMVGTLYSMAILLMVVEVARAKAMLAQTALLEAGLITLIPCLKRVVGLFMVKDLTEALGQLPQVPSEAAAEVAQEAPVGMVEDFLAMVDKAVGSVLTVR
jgi:hypothetical protein